MRVPLLLSLAAMAPLFSGCSVLYGDQPVGQCSTTADCLNEPGLQDRVCDVVNRVCVIDNGPQKVVEAPQQEGCVSTEQCTRDNSNKPSVCRKPGQGAPCVDLATPECTDVSGAWDAPDAFFIGSVSPLTQRQLTSDQSLAFPYVKRLIQAVNLGLDEWNENQTNGLPLSNRPLAAVHCNSNADPDQAHSVMQHLVGAVQAPVVLVAGDRDLLELTPDAVAAETALICIDCGTSPAADSDEAGLVWRMTPPLITEAPLLVWRAQQLASQLRQQRELEPEAKLRVAFLYGDYPGLDDLAAAVRQSLDVNGQVVGLDPDDYLEVKTPDARYENVDQQKFADQLIEFSPDILLVSHGPDFTTFYLHMLEDGWPADVPKPYYVTTSSQMELESLKPYVVDNEDLRTRISGTRLASDPGLRENLAGFTSRYRAVYNGAWPDGGEVGYEAFYATAYALVLADHRRQLGSGPEIARGFEMLAAGSQVNIGPEPIARATGFLQASTSIDLVGLSSELDWDANDRKVRGDVGLWCLARSADGKISLVDDAGPRWHYSSGEVTGEYACP
jgi:hypothetical protein